MILSDSYIVTPASKSIKNGTCCLPPSFSRIFLEGDPLGEDSEQKLISLSDINCLTFAQ